MLLPIARLVYDSYGVLLSLPGDGGDGPVTQLFPAAASFAVKGLVWSLYNL